MGHPVHRSRWIGFRQNVGRTPILDMDRDGGGYVGGAARGPELVDHRAGRD